MLRNGHHRGQDVRAAGKGMLREAGLSLFALADSRCNGGEIQAPVAGSIEITTASTSVVERVGSNQGTRQLPVTRVWLHRRYGEVVMTKFSELKALGCLLLRFGCLGPLVSACGGNGTDPTPDELLGTPFTPANGIESSGGRLAWSPDGAELVYTAGMGNLVTLEEYSPGEGNHRVIDGRLRSRGPLAFALSGRVVCASSDALMPSESDSYECLDRTDGSILVLTDRPVYGPASYGALTVGAESLVAYGVIGPECVPGLGGSTCDSLYLYDLSTNTRTFLTIGLPDVFSPNGRQLLYRERPCNELGGGNTCSTATFDLTTQGTTPIWPGLSTDILWLPHWNESGPQRLVVAKAGAGPSQVDSLVIRSLAQNTSRVIRDLGLAPAGFVFPSPALSADGSTVAYWVVAPTQGVSYLEVSKLATNHTEIIAVAYGTDTGGIALSSNGQRVAYVFASRGYWTDIE